VCYPTPVDADYSENHLLSNESRALSRIDVDYTVLCSDQFEQPRPKNFSPGASEHCIEGEVLKQTIAIGKNR
jgi:hypothetical protein